jgi:predicted nuclease of predicted toxin-antitoxin system
MTLWIDAQISPHLAPWLAKEFEIEVYSMEYLKLDEADDETIFEAAKKENAIVLSKDEDFLNLYRRLGAPPKLIWLTCGNTSNNYLKRLLAKTLKDALLLLEQDDLVEISDAVS